MRKSTAKKRILLPDPIYNDILVTRFLNSLMYDGKKNTAQIKPFKYFTSKDGKYTIFGTGNVKSYKTDLLIFIKYNNDMLIFDNNKTKIVGGNFVFDESSLIYPK